MNVHIDHEKRFNRIREEMEKNNIDILIGSRVKSVTYVSGAFVPWRSVVLVSRDGHQGLNTLLIDRERIANDSWLDNVTAYAPLPGMDLWEITVQQIRELGYERATIGVELGHSPRGNTGYLFATEYQMLQEALPEAKLVNALAVMDRAAFVKDQSEIRLMRQAAAIADAAIERVKESLYIGISEAEIAGIGEMELRRLGSEYHWAVTGSSEVASGYRATYQMNGTTQPTEKRVQKGENIIVDFHPLYRLYCSDLSHNFILGKPTMEQQKLADVYLQTVDTIVKNLKAGNTVGDVHQRVTEKIAELGYAEYVIPSFGHGLGIMGHEWYPAIVNNDEFRDVVFEENVVEVAFLAMTVPGVCGMRLEYPVLVTGDGGEPLCKTPIELSVIDL